jgi:predicted ATP-grasp superfamily ATP-dependent carboligase
MLTRSPAARYTKSVKAATPSAEKTPDICDPEGGDLRADRSRPAVIVAPVHVNGLCVVREMARKGAYVVAVDTDGGSLGFRSRCVRERVLIDPPAQAPGTFAKWLLSRRDLDGAIVVPTDDFLVREIAGAYDELKSRFRLACAPPEAVRTALDKDLAYAAAESAGVPHPRTCTLDPGCDLAEAGAHIGLPALLRPAFSISFYRRFHTKSFVVADQAELDARFAEASAAGHRMLLQEIIPGPDENVVSCKAYVTDAGEMMGAVAGFKSAIYPPGFGVSQVQVARKCAEVEENTASILRAIGFRGSLVSVEWKLDPRDGVWKFLEVNARSVLAIRLMKFVGSDIIDMLWRDKLGLPQAPPRPIRYGRRWAYVKNGLLLWRKHPEARRPFLEYLRLYRPPIVPTVFDWRDPLPFVHDIMPIIGRRFARKSPQ